MNVSPRIIFISPRLNKQKPWGCINYPQGDYPSDCVNRKLRDFSRSFFIYILTL